MRTLMMSMLVLSCAARAADTPACAPPAPAQAVVRLAQLPSDVREALLSNGPVSDPGGPFNAGDVVDESAQPEPRQRLVSGQAGSDVICLRVEQGGRGLHHAVMRFQRDGQHWTLVSQVNQDPYLR